MNEFAGVVDINVDRSSKAFAVGCVESKIFFLCDVSLFPTRVSAVMSNGIVI